MRSGEEGPLLRFPSCVPLPGVGSPAPFSLALSRLSLPPLPHRYGGFSLGGRDVNLPSGQEVGRSLEELRVLLSPQPGGALDRILSNLIAWARGLDAQDSLKVGTGDSGQAAVGGGADFLTLTP